MRLRKPELLAPAGNFEKLKTAIHFGADAVYGGVKGFSLRSISEFDENEILRSIKYVKESGKKLYLCLNLFAKSDDIARLDKLVPFFRDNAPDSFIVSDPGVVNFLKDNLPQIPIHLSTQANTTNSSSVKFWRDPGGVKRVTLARELNMEEIKKIREDVRDVELEVFIHGALCLSYSGRCYLSEYLNKRSANRGDCTQPCRWKYSLNEETREGIYFPVEEDERGTFIMNYRDLCLAKKIPELILTGIDSFKIEGRNKSSYYIASVVRVYRDIIDSFMKERESFRFRDEWDEELRKVSHRGYTEGFMGESEDEDNFFYDHNYVQNYKPVGIVRDIEKTSDGKSVVMVDVRNKIEKGDEIECISPEMKTLSFTPGAIRANNGEIIESANPGMSVKIEISADYLLPGDFLRKREIDREKIKKGQPL